MFIILNIQATDFSLQSSGETIGGSTIPETSSGTFIMTEEPQLKLDLCKNMLTFFATQYTKCSMSNEQDV